MLQLDFFALSPAWYILPTILLLLSLLYLKNGRRRTDLGNIPSVSLLPLLSSFFIRLIRQGELYRFSDNFVPVFTGLFHLYRKEKIIQTVWARRRFVLCFGVTTSEKIFRSAIDINKEPTFKIVEPWLGTGLLLSGGDKWRKRRKMLTPAFHLQILKDFLLIFNDHSKILIEKLKKSEGEIVRITSILQFCALDIIIESALGVRLNAQEGGCTEFVCAVKHVTSDIIQHFMKPWYWIKPLYNLLPVAKQAKTNRKVAHGFTTNIIQRRKAELLKGKEAEDIIDDFRHDRDDLGTKKRRILLDLLLYYHLIENSLSEDDIREEVDNFTLAGFGSTSMAISWVLYLLGWHKEAQDKVQEELNRIFGEDLDRAVTTDDLKQMKYLECVMKEAQRVYPLFPFIARHTSEDIEADGYIIPANSSVVICIYAIHHDPTIYPNPEIFDPDRFTPENCSGRHPFSFVPFSAGPRNCIGQRFAMMSMKTILSYILRNFTVRSLDQQDKLVFAGDIILRPKNPIRIILDKK